MIISPCAHRADSSSRLTHGKVSNVPNPGDPQLLAGVCAALLGAVAMSIGAQLQNSGVGLASLEGRASFLSLICQRAWVFRTLTLGLAIALQLTAISLAPVSVVQPIGIVALVVSVAIRHVGERQIPSRRAVSSVLAAVIGLGAFVAVAGRNGGGTEGTVESSGSVLAVLATSLTVVSILSFGGIRRHPLVPIVGAGVLFGLAITVVKLILTGVQRIIEAGWDSSTDAVQLAACALIGAIAFGIGTYLLQVAHRKALADLVIAGLTVVDPMVAAALGIGLLHETAGSPPWVTIALLASGAVAATGVVLLSRDAERSASPKTQR